jgi:hypothetical protein
LLIVGGPATVTVAVLLVAPAPDSFDETAPVVFACAPTVTPVTFTPNVHDALAASVPPDKFKLLAPAVAVTVPLPQVPVSPFGEEITNPTGNVSTNPTPVSADVFPAGFVIVKVNVVDPFRGMLAAPNALLIVGAKTIPVPLKANVCGLFEAVSVTDSVATRAPVAPGVKVTVIVHVAPLSTGLAVLQVPPLEKSALSVPVKMILTIVSVLPLLLVNVTVDGLLATPTTWFPKAMLEGAKLTGRVCRKIETLLAFPLATARSSAPSPLKSAVATPNAPLAVVNVVADPKVPLPAPKNKKASPAVRSDKTRSRFPSPL